MRKRIIELVGTLSEEEINMTKKYYNCMKNIANSTDKNWDGIRKEGQLYKYTTKEDWENAFIFSISRKIINNRKKVKDMYCGDNAMLGEILGMLGEICTAKIFKVEWDHSVSLKYARRYDLLIKNSSIDVKTCLPKNNYKDKVVVSESKKIGDSIFYFFTRIQNDGYNKVVNIKGWATQKEIINNKNKMYNRKGYWLKNSELHLFKKKTPQISI